MLRPFAHPVGCCCKCSEMLVQKFDRFQTLRINSQQPQAAQAQSVSLILIHMVSYWVILEMALNIKDLYGNSGKRFRKINTS